MMRIRGLRTAAICAAATVLATAGCSGGSAKKTELKLYNDKNAWTPYFNQIGALSKQQIGLSVKPVGYSDEPTYNAFITASFRTKIKPDLFTWQTGSKLKDIVDLKQVADTSAIWQQGIKNGDLSQDVEKYFTIGGKQYCVPTNVAYWGMFYNKKTFAKYGLQPPATWNDLLKIADTLKQHGQKAFFTQATPNLFTFTWFQQLLAGSDPALYDRLSTGQAKYTDPGVVAAMTRWKSMMDAGYFSDPGDTSDPGDAFKSGKAAMVNYGTFFATSLTQRGMKPGSDYGFFVIPSVNPSLPKTPLIFETGPLCSLNKAADPEANKKFLNWWVTPAAQEKWSASRGDVSANPKVKVANPEFAPVSKDAGTGKYQLVQRYFEATPAPVLTAALDGFSGFLTNPASYMKVLQTIQKAADGYWSQHKSGS